MTVCDIVTQIAAHPDERQDYQQLLLTEVVLVYEGDHLRTCMPSTSHSITQVLEDRQHEIYLPVHFKPLRCRRFGLVLCSRFLQANAPLGAGKPCSS